MRDSRSMEKRHGVWVGRYRGDGTGRRVLLFVILIHLHQHILILHLIVRMDLICVIP